MEISSVVFKFLIFLAIGLNPSISPSSSLIFSCQSVITIKMFPEEGIERSELFFSVYFTNIMNLAIFQKKNFSPLIPLPLQLKIFV